MNELDKILAEINKQVDAETKKNKTRQEAEPKADGNKDQIAEMLEALGKEVRGVVEGMVLVEGDGDKIKDFYICNHTVTQKEFKKTMGINPSQFRRGNRNLTQENKQNLEADTSDYPVEWVSWYDAIYYCNKRSMEEGLTPVYTLDKKIDVTEWEYEPCEGHDICDSKKRIKRNFNANGYRLPTSVEWKYAARGGKESKGYKYAGSDEPEEVAWYDGNAKGVTHKAMQKKPNELGIYDMSGNVWEWCWDSYGSNRVLRGGSFYSNDGCCAVANRSDGIPYELPGGFRLVRSSSRR